jgi:peroxiredoxin
MPEINRLAPDFELRGLDGSIHRLSDYRGRIVVVNFWSMDCPHVTRTDALILAAMKRWGEDVVLLAIASNANESLSALENASRSRGLPTVLIDAKQEAADAYAAQVTPEVHVIDREGVVRFHGPADDVSFCQRVATRSYVEDAVDALLAGELPAVTEVPAFGCTIIREA